MWHDTTFLPNNMFKLTCLQNNCKHFHPGFEILSKAVTEPAWPFSNKHILNIEAEGRAAVCEHMLSPHSKHRLAHCFCNAISSLHFGRTCPSPRWHRRARSVEREEDICAASTRPACVGLPSSHIGLCRKDGWGVEIYSWLSAVYAQVSLQVRV